MLADQYSTSNSGSVYAVVPPGIEPSSGMSPSSFGYQNQVIGETDDYDSGDDWEDRDEYERRMRLAEESVAKKEAERQEAIHWIQSKQGEFLKETYELQEQLTQRSRRAAEDVEAENRGLVSEIEALEREYRELEGIKL